MLSQYRQYVPSIKSDSNTISRKYSAPDLRKRNGSQEFSGSPTIRFAQRRSNLSNSFLPQEDSDSAAASPSPPQSLDDALARSMIMLRLEQETKQKKEDSPDSPEQ